MPWSISSQPEPDAEALQRLKDQVRELGGSFDAELTRKLKTAINHVQDNTNRQLLQATAVLNRDSFPSGNWLLPPSPLQSVTSVTYLDGDGNSQTWATSNYEVITTEEPGYIRLAQDGEYPTSIQSPRGGVTVTYVVGYGTGWGDVSDTISDAVMLWAHHFYRPEELGIRELAVDALIRALVGDDFIAQGGF